MPRSRPARRFALGALTLVVLAAGTTPGSAGAEAADGHVINDEAAQRLSDHYAIAVDTFGVLLIGKDGGEKLRVDEVPDLSAIYAVIDGMPMGSREVRADPSRC